MRIAANLILLFTFLFSTLSFAQNQIEKLTTSINGTIINSETNASAMVSSENGKYWCTYEVLAATDEMRELGNLKVYKNEKVILVLNKIPGSDLSITNSGRIVFYDHSEHFNGKVKIHSYSEEGEFLFTKMFEGATQFEFSPSGERMGVRTPEGISIITLSNGSTYVIEKGFEFAFNEDDTFVAVAPSNKILIYQNSFQW